MKKLTILLAIVLLLSSCANEKRFVHYESPTSQFINVVEPYGWATLDEKQDSIKYRVSVGNVVWSIILSETIVVPVVLTGWYLFEPVSEIKQANH